MKVLDALWPAEIQIRETLGSDAHTLDEAVFLAVHQPMTFRRIDYGSTTSDLPLVDEGAVLEALLAEDGEGRVIVPIAGPSGAGKSHVIKWLEAKLRARDDADHRHVILVPKSSSLKSVLRRILHDLEGPRYDEVRSRLERASESLPQVAAKDLRTRIVAVLQSDAAAATERIHSRSSTDRRTDEMRQWGRDLAALLEDPELWDRHFYGNGAEPRGVMAKLAANVTREGAANRRYQFEAHDFDNLVADIDPSELSVSARRPLRYLADAKYRADAAQVFNGVLDRATQSLLDLGGTPLSEVFLELRRALLEDGKELVILVEDFAVLSGMQGALLDALIHEARVGGHREYCTIRSALAYTHGYQPMNRDTVRTRAGAEWLLEEVPGSEDEILARAVELVGAYLNAARWGVKALRTQRDEEPEGDGCWLKSFEAETETEEEAQAIEAFGRSGAGYPLFPLNVGAIRQLSREKCRVNDKLVFNPRLIIDRLVLDLLKLRKHYEKRAFPPETIGTSKMTSPQVLRAIQAQTTDSTKKPLLTLVTYWAEMPDSTTSAAARLAPAVYEAFGFAPIDFGAPAPPPRTEATHGDQLGPRTQVPESVPVDPFESEWAETLNAWQRGEELGSIPARKLRNSIAEALFATLPVDWPGARPALDRSAVAKDHVYLPNARGGAGMEADDVAIALCKDDEWSDPLRAAPIREHLEAVIRFHEMKATQGTWDWEGGERAAARYAAFVAERRGRLMDWLAARRPRARKLPNLSVTNLVESRLLAAAVLGAGVRGGNHLDSAVDVLFKVLDPPKVDPSHPDKWQRLLHEAYVVAEKARSDLLDEVAAYQGIGKKVLAVDIAQLERPVRQFMKNWTLSEGPSAQNNFERIVRYGVQERRNQLKKWRESTLDWLGEHIDKQAFVEQIRELLNQASRHHLIHRDKIEDLRRLLVRFRDAPVVEAFNVTEQALREPHDGTTLASLAYDDAHVLQITNALGPQLSRTLDEIEREVEGVIASSGIREVEALAAQVRAEFDALNEMLTAYEKVQAP